MSTKTCPTCNGSGVVADPDAVVEPIPGQLDLADVLAEHPGGARADDPDTAKAAKYANLPGRASLRFRVLAEFAYEHTTALARGREPGMTDDELYEAFPGYPLSSVAKRRGELRDGGWLEDSGRRRKTNRGLDAVVWAFTKVGRDRWVDEARRQLEPVR